MGVCDQLHASIPPYPQETVPNGLKAGWAPEPVWILGEELNMLPLPGAPISWLSNPWPSRYPGSTEVMFSNRIILSIAVHTAIQYL
jgi:hypothetical protein